MLAFPHVTAVSYTVMLTTQDAFNQGSAAASAPAEPEYNAYASYSPSGTLPGLVDCATSSLMLKSEQNKLLCFTSWLLCEKGA